MRIRIGLPLLGILAGLAIASCATTPGPATAARAQPSQPARPDYTLRGRLDRVIDHRLSEQQTVAALQGISVGSYDVQDPLTFWAHTSAGGSDPRDSLYYFTYRRTYFVLLLRDEGDGRYSCLDAKVMKRTQADYELGSARLVNGELIEPRLVIVYNKKENSAYPTDIEAAFRPDLKSGTLVPVDPQSAPIRLEE